MNKIQREGVREKWRTYEEKIMQAGGTAERSPPATPALTWYRS